MTTTSDRNHPGINKPGKNGQNEAYVVLSEEERAKGFVAPVRHSYIHDACGVETRMNAAIAETYARDPKYYGATFCVCCKGHFPVAEFQWADGSGAVGSIPSSPPASA